MEITTAYENKIRFTTKRILIVNYLTINTFLFTNQKDFMW